ncbi:hypothetical protein LUX39_24470 [Actinomadura madurae]|nr:hypothetical protein [Actinomadura madurae]MCP9967844.1 hypothetical protein [Actinomadura madurae]MCQ0016507.1 hypothetical protein [Actinomadura madurae]
MADHEGGVQVEVVDDGLHVVQDRVPLPRSVAGQPVAAQVHGDDPVRAGQQRRDRVPVQQGAAQTVQEQDRGSVAAVVADGKADWTVIDGQVVRCHENSPDG